MAARAVPFDDSLSISNERRAQGKLRIVPQPGKGRPPLRKCPEDFDIAFVEIGRNDCETFYRAARVTIDRWLMERGKDRLIDLRAKFVEHERKTFGPMIGRNIRGNPKPKVCSAPQPIKDDRSVSPCIASAAAQFMRNPRNGGWVVSRTPQGDWFVGIARRTAGQLLDMAVARGFDVELVNAMCEISDKIEGQMRL